MKVSYFSTFLILIFTFIASFQLFSPSIATAQIDCSTATGIQQAERCEAENTRNEMCREGSFLGLPTWHKYLNKEVSNGECSISFDPTKDVAKVLLAIFEILLRIAGMVAVVFVIVGGFQYILTQGEPDKAKAAKNTIMNALIGVVIAMAASVIVGFIARSIT